MMISGETLVPDIEKSYSDFIKENSREFYEAALTNPDVLDYLMKKRLIPAGDADELLQRALESENTAAVAVLHRIGSGSD